MAETEQRLVQAIEAAGLKVAARMMGIELPL